jgi:hypothetical protein
MAPPSPRPQIDPLIKGMEAARAALASPPSSAGAFAAAEAAARMQELMIAVSARTQLTIATFYGSVLTPLQVAVMFGAVHPRLPSFVAIRDVLRGRGAGGGGGGVPPASVVVQAAAAAARGPPGPWAMS